MSTSPALHGLLRPSLTGDCDGEWQAIADKAHVEKRTKMRELKSLKAEAARKAVQAMADDEGLLSRGHRGDVEC